MSTTFAPGHSRPRVTPARGPRTTSARRVTGRRSNGSLAAPALAPHSGRARHGGGLSLSGSQALSGSQVVRACQDVRVSSESELGAGFAAVVMVGFTILVTVAIVVAAVVLWQASSPVG